MAEPWVRFVKISTLPRNNQRLRLALSLRPDLGIRRRVSPAVSDIPLNFVQFDGIACHTMSG
jgi:hypothetical protein